MTFTVANLKGSLAYIKGKCVYAVVDSDRGSYLCFCRFKRDAEWIASLINGNWKGLCCKFIGRTRRLDFFKKKNFVNTIVRKEKQMVQSAYDEMTNVCLKDAEFRAFWES